eukprot:GILK01001672.1.p1 GENE.GILK01001672.1~~GILK01001672.1.p1  ORF type:complete len:249 (-),score=39.98 GILK01001672.1:110-820(-)
MSTEDGKKWFPLESNPDVMNQYIERLGWPTAMFRFCDVLSTEDWALEMVPRPCVAVVMLFPIKPESETYSHAEQDKIKNDGQILSNNVFFMKQYIGNACGTIGILHSLGNLTDKVELISGSFFDRFFRDSRSKTAQEIGELLQQSDEIEEAHEAAVESGETEVPPIEEDINTHFVAFVEKDGYLYELDGRKQFPINHGPTTTDTLLEDACKVIRSFMDRDPGELRFTITALAAASD